MTKAKKFYKHNGSLYFLSDSYISWLNKNQNIKVISTVFERGTLLVTFEESEKEEYNLGFDAFEEYKKLNGLFTST